MAIQNWMNANAAVHSRVNAPRPKSDKSEGANAVFSKILKSKTPDSNDDSKPMARKDNRFDKSGVKDNVIHGKKRVKEASTKELPTNEVEEFDEIDFDGIEDQTEKIKALLQLLNQMIEKIQKQPEVDAEVSLDMGSAETVETTDVMADLEKLQEMVVDVFSGKKENIALVGALNQLKAELEAVDGVKFSLKEALHMESFKKMILDATAALKSNAFETVNQASGLTEDTVISEIVDLPKEPKMPVTKTEQSENPVKDVQKVDMPKALTESKPIENVVADEVPLEKVVTDKQPVSTQFQQLINKQPIGVLQPSQEPLVSKNPIVNQVFNLVKGPIQINESGTMLKMKLQPEELGNVQLKLSLQKGVVLAELKVENELVKAAVESNLDQLKQNLSNRGFQVSQVSVAVDLNNKDQTASNFSQQQHQQNNGKKHYFDGVEDVSDDKIFETLHLKEKGIGNSIDYLG